MNQVQSEQHIVFDLLSKPHLRRPYGRYGARRNKVKASVNTPSSTLSPTQAQGQEFEQRAINFLQTKGMKLIAKNLRCKVGEIDCVMLHEKTLVFVEVRQRSQQYFGDAAASITKQKQGKIKRSANYFLPKLCRHLGLREIPSCRFDVVTFDGKEQRYQWLINAFS